MANFDVLINKLMSDRALASTLVSDPEGTLRAHGIEPTAEMLSAIRGLDPASVERLVGAFGAAAASAG